MDLSNLFNTYIQYLLLVRHCHTRSETQNRTTLTTSKAILQLNSIPSDTLRLDCDSTGYRYRIFDKTSTWLTKFPWHEIFTEKKDVMENCSHSLDLIIYNQSTIEFEIYTHVTGSIKGVWKTTKNQLKLVNLVILNWHTVLIAAHFLERKLLVFESCFCRKY